MFVCPSSHQGPNLMYKHNLLCQYSFPIVETLYNVVRTALVAILQLVVSICQISVHVFSTMEVSSLDLKLHTRLSKLLLRIENPVSSFKTLRIFSGNSLILKYTIFAANNQNSYI